MDVKVDKDGGRSYKTFLSGYGLYWWFMLEVQADFTRLLEDLRARFHKMSLGNFFGNCSKKI